MPDPIAGGLTAVSLFTEDLAGSVAFYRELFGLDAVHEDAQSTAFRLGGTIVNVLTVDAAPELVEPAVVAEPEAGSRFVLTVTVDDVDARAADLVSRGARLVNGPQDRPWGIRTATIADPGGHLWELAADLD